MQFSIAATLALAGSALAAYSNVTYTYETTVLDVVTEVVTYCPEPTTFVYNNKTIHVTAPTTLTVTDCPCTIPKTHTVTTDVPPQHKTTSSAPIPSHTVSTISHGGAAKAGVAGLAGVAAAAAYLL